jgi:hypothetical protein
VQTVRHFFPELPKWLGEMPDSRFKPFITYVKPFLFWWGLLLFVLKLGSRRQLDFDLRDDETEVLDNVNRLAKAEQETLPVHGTLNHFIGHVGADPFAVLRRKMVRRLIRMKALDGCRLRGRFVFVADGTGHLCFHKRHCEHCLEQKHGKKTIYMHQVLEAKLVSPSGLSLSVGSEFIENPSEFQDATGASEEQRKQDCELKALSRLAPGLKRDFPQTRICLAGDNIFACGRAIQIATDNGWSYVYTFKPGRMPAVWADFQALLKLAPENTLRITTPDKVKRLYRWVNAMTYQDDQKRTHKFDAIQCEETRDGETHLFAWITNIPVGAKSVDAIAIQGGRDRWKIENQGFNTQKNSDLNLEHAYSTGPEKIKAYYYLLQIAHIILQLLEMGSLLQRLARTHGKTPLELFGSLKRIARRLLECFRYYRLPDEAYAAGTTIRIRLDTS